MRIALVSARLPNENNGGAEAYVAALAGGLASEHDVALFTGSPPMDIDGVTVERIPKLPDLGHSASNSHKTLWHLREQWMPHVRRELAQQLRHGQYELVNTHELQGLSAAAYAGIADADIPHVHTAHDLNLLCMQVTMTRDGSPCDGACKPCRLQRHIRVAAIQRRLDRFIALSAWSRDKHVEYGVITASQAVVIPQGVQPGLARLRKKTTQLRIGYIGSLVPLKGLRTLVEAFVSTPGDWTLDIAGDGPMMDWLRIAAAASGKIFVRGYVNGPAKESFFDGLDILVIPSEGNETAPLAAIEACVRGIPVVAADHSGLREIPGAAMYRTGDANDLQRALYDTEENLEKRSESILARVADFSWSEHLERVESVLRETAESSSSSRRTARSQPG